MAHLVSSSPALHVFWHLAVHNVLTDNFLFPFPVQMWRFAWMRMDLFCPSLSGIRHTEGRNPTAAMLNLQKIQDTLINTTIISILNQLKVNRPCIFVILQPLLKWLSKLFLPANKMTQYSVLFMCRMALCLDGQSRFCNNTKHLLGKEVTKRRHLHRMGYEVVQVCLAKNVASKLKLHTDKVCECPHHKFG